MTDALTDENYPECAKLNKVHDKMMTLLQFLQYMREQDMEFGITYEGDPRLARIHKRDADLLHQYFDIDQNKLDDERKAILTSIRENTKRDQPTKDQQAVTGDVRSTV